MNAVMAEILSLVVGSLEDGPLKEKAKQAIIDYQAVKDQPVSNVMWVPLEMVTPNDYNPNSVAKIEMGLLYTSIEHDGYTQPVVTIWDAEQEKYVIVDGFHRYYVMKTCPDIYERCHGHLPIVVLQKGINDRMASTVRHNRARGKHSVQGMSAMVFNMLDQGWPDEKICNELGMGPKDYDSKKEADPQATGRPH